MNFEEKISQVINNLRLIDDVLFSACFEDNPRDVQYVLRIILDKPDLEVTEVQTQKEVENIYGRAVKFDIFAHDSEGKLYNIEMQRLNSGAIPRRARYNSSMLDFHQLKKGSTFEQLPETYVIFITEHDVIGSGNLIYHIERTIQETNKTFDDGAHIIFVNGSYSGSEKNDLTTLIHDFFCTNPQDMKHNQIAERVKFLKNNMQEVSKLHWFLEENFGDEIEEMKEKVRNDVTKKVTDEVTQKITQKVTDEVTQKNLVESVRNLMKNLNWSAKKSMEALSIPQDRQEKILSLI